jgi:hypothetical protein
MQLLIQRIHISIRYVYYALGYKLYDSSDVTITFISIHLVTDYLATLSEAEAT